MTYKQLKDVLDQATPSQLSDDVTAMITDANNEMYPVHSIDLVLQDDVLHKDHLFLMI